MWIYGGAHDNTVGGDASGERNVIAGNDRDGVRLAAGTGNVVSGNHIGVQANGQFARGNAEYGVHILSAGQEHLVGGDTTGERNVISANLVGVVIAGTNTMNNTVSGNYIGVIAGGFASLPNLEDGVRLDAGAQQNLVGGDAAGERNVISANGDYGVLITGAGTNSNTVSGNYLGADSTGNYDLGNTLNGVGIGLGAQNNLIGGDTAGERNVISGNDNYGVGIWGSSTTGNVVSGNYIGLNRFGAAAVGNTYSGVVIAGASANTIGGDVEGERNVISGNGDNGVALPGATANVISGNYIGTDATGAAAVANAEDGVYLVGPDNVVGGDTPGERNVISGNGQIGVHLEGSATTENTISGNYIGVDASGTADLGNFFHGVVIEGGANLNVIGGLSAGERNVISGHGNYGVGLWGDDTNWNNLLGNYIGADASGGGDLGNGGFGVFMTDEVEGNWVFGGVIAHNGQDGFCGSGSTLTRGFISQASIYDNGWSGIALMDGANGDIAAPVITSVSLEAGSVVIRGTACADCIVEVFASSTDDGEGEMYLGDAAATGGGGFTRTTDSLLYPYLTATARDPSLGTSEFSAVFSPHFYFLPLVLR